MLKRKGVQPRNAYVAEQAQVIKTTEGNYLGETAPSSDQGVLISEETKIDSCTKEGKQCKKQVI
jgi:hypothetical protein